MMRALGAALVFAFVLFVFLVAPHLFGEFLPWLGGRINWIIDWIQAHRAQPVLLS